MQKRAVISINTSWNIVNFRSGLIAALNAAGYEVVAVAPEDAHSAKLAALGAAFVPLEIDSKNVSVGGNLSLALRYWRVLRGIRPAVYLGFTAKPNIYGSLAAGWSGAAVINNVSGLGTAFIRENWLTHVVSALYRFAFARSATVFFQNRDDRDLFVAKRIVRPEQARLLPGSGVDLTHFAPRPAQGDGSSFTFLLPARLLWDKGVGEFVEAARLVRAELPQARFQLLGFLDVVNRTAVPRADVDAWVAEGLIEYLGATDDVRPFLAAADCVVLPSYREGLPRSLLEAAAMGLPTIATDVPGCRDVTRHDINGFLCAVRDAGSLAEAMLVMARLPAGERARLGANARKLAEEVFDERVVVQRYMEAITEAIAARR